MKYPELILYLFLVLNSKGYNETAQKKRQDIVRGVIWGAQGVDAPYCDNLDRSRCAFSCP